MGAVGALSVEAHISDTKFLIDAEFQNALFYPSKSAPFIIISRDVMPAGSRYVRVLVAQTCADVSGTVISTAAECAMAGAQLGVGSNVQATFNSLSRPAGCMDYTSHNTNHKLEFNLNLDSTWTST